MTNTKSCDVLISGGGLAGLTCAYSLAKSGKKTIICRPSAKFIDQRTTALLNDSIDYFNKIGLWDEMKSNAHPLKTMRLVDGSKRLFRFPQSDFRASEIDAEAFGYNVKNQDLIDLLNSKLKTNELIEVIDGKLDTIETGKGPEVLINLETKQSPKTKVVADFIIGADGRNSFVREHFEYGERWWDYGQMALVADFDHEISSDYASTEFQTEDGPFTIVPHTHTSAGLVWLQTPDQAKERVEMKEDQLNLLLEEFMQSFLGKVSIRTKPKLFPIKGMIANRFGDKDHALIGEAAHVFPPIGAQGFNLGIRDIRTILEVLNSSPKTENPGDRYHQLQSADISSRTFGVDLLNRSLLTDFLPIQMLRSAGIVALNKVPPLRKRIMQMGITSIVGD